MTEMKKHVETLIEQAAKAKDSGDAMRFAQAAVNAANAMCAAQSAIKQQLQDGGSLCSASRHSPLQPQALAGALPAVDSHGMTVAMSETTVEPQATTAINEMVEIAARACFVNWRAHCDADGDKAGARTFEELDNSERAFAIENARAVILALRNATVAMLERGAKMTEDSREHARVLWETMIDEAVR